MTISAELKNVYASAVADRRYIETLELSHSKFTKTYYLTNDWQVWSFKDEGGTTRSFESIPFEIVLPSTAESGLLQDMKIAIANTGREMVTEIENAVSKPDEPITCIYRVYLDIAGSDPQIDPPLDLKITRITLDDNVISAAATRYDVLNRAFPNEYYTRATFPGLDR